MMRSFCGQYERWNVPPSTKPSQIGPQFPTNDSDNPKQIRFALLHHELTFIP